MIEALCKTWQHAGAAGPGIVIPFARVPFKPGSSWEDFFEGMVLVYIEGLREEVKCPLLRPVVDWFSAFYVEDADWFEGIFHALVVTKLAGQPRAPPPGPPRAPPLGPPGAP